MGGKPREHIPHTPAEKAELVKFLVDLGYVQYATPEFISKMDALGYDSIEDLPNLAQEDDYEELGMPEKHAEKIEEAALKELLRRFLAAIPEGSTAACTKLERHRPAGHHYALPAALPPAYAYASYTAQPHRLCVLPTAAGMEKHLDRFIENDYDEIEDLEDLDEDDAEELGLTAKEIEVLSHRAEMHVARTVVTWLLRTHRDRSQPSSEFPFREPAVYKPLLEALLQAGVTEVEDVAHLKPGQVRPLVRVRVRVRVRIRVSLTLILTRTLTADGMAKIVRLGFMLLPCLLIGGWAQ